MPVAPLACGASIVVPRLWCLDLGHAHPRRRGSGRHENGRHDTGYDTSCRRGPAARPQVRGPVAVLTRPMQWRTLLP